MKTAYFIHGEVAQRPKLPAALVQDALGVFVEQSHMARVQLEVDGVPYGGVRTVEVIRHADEDAFIVEGLDEDDLCGRHLAFEGVPPHAVRGLMLVTARIQDDGNSGGDGNSGSSGGVLVLVFRKMMKRLWVLLPPDSGVYRMPEMVFLSRKNVCLTLHATRAMFPPGALRRGESIETRLAVEVVSNAVLEFAGTTAPVGKWSQRPPDLHIAGGYRQFSFTSLTFDNGNLDVKIKDVPMMLVGMVRVGLRRLDEHTLGLVVRHRRTDGIR
jgi:hypothetical protein